mmetsp:Transcript_22072/g.49064  ORF Transcript_22072/g.49064 Transcript_22072/m.49064 type:complete len:194 (-) Transcript_22072:145-726(-)
MAPKFQIQSHVLVFGLLLTVGTAGALGFSAAFGSTDEEKRKLLTEKYPDRIKKSEDQRRQMQLHFDKMKNGSAGVQDGALEEKFDQVLRGGKADSKKRLHELRMQHEATAAAPSADPTAPAAAPAPPAAAVAAIALPTASPVPSIVQPAPQQQPPQTQSRFYSATLYEDNDSDSDDSRRRSKKQRAAANSRRK